MKQPDAAPEAAPEATRPHDTQTATVEATRRS
jgi:hypothetical protein